MTCDPTTETKPENLKIAAGASKPPVGIVPLHPLLGLARVLEDSAVKYAPFNYMVQSIADACESYSSAELRHTIQSTLLGGQVTPESLAAIDEDSGLPHIFHRAAGLFILISLMIRDGIIPADPGMGKRKRASLAPAEPEEHANGCRDLGCFGCTEEPASAWPTVETIDNGDGTYTATLPATFTDEPGVKAFVPGAVLVLDAQNMAKLDPDAARRAAAERELAERKLEPSRAPMTNHHDPYARRSTP